MQGGQCFRGAAEPAEEPGAVHVSRGETRVQAQCLAQLAERVLRMGARHLAPGGTFAAAIVEGVPDVLLPRDAAAALPDIREVGGDVYVSQPLGSVTENGVIASERRRQRVSSAGDLVTEDHVDRLAVLEAGSLQAEASEVGLAATGTLAVPPTDLHVGSEIVLFQRTG